jgi:hypothetical protein
MTARLFVFFAAFTTSIRAQIFTLPEIITDTIPGSYAVRLNQPYIFIASSFGSEKIENNQRLDSVSGFYISEIVLVYSAYRKAGQFDQARLNKTRWENLGKTYPSLFLNGPTRFANVCQEGQQTDSAARQLTHGFYIYFRNRSDSTERKAEIAELSRMMLAMGIDTSATGDDGPLAAEKEIPFNPVSKKHPKFKKPLRAKDPKACRQPFYGSGTEDLELFFKGKISLTARQKRKPRKLLAEVRLRLDYNGFIKSAYILCANKKLIDQIRLALSDMNVWNPAVKNGLTVKSDVKFSLHMLPGGTMGLVGGITVPRNLANCGTAPDSVLFDFTVREKKSASVPTVFEVPDKAILRDVIERNPALDSLLLVVDLTGSMGPYIAQVLDLMEELVINDNPHVSCISLFNDGDSKPDRKKEVGKTGGIITLNSDITLENLGKAILKSMKRGSGGDCMENNLEAIIKGWNDCRDCRDIVMIADNLATPRDVSLVSDLKQPVHWVLCGVNEDINVNYLDLVRANKGFLHTSTSDVANLHLVKDNGIIEIDGYSYQLRRGRFMLMKLL